MTQNTKNMNCGDAEDKKKESDRALSELFC